jgi:hypothetical protein
VTDTIEGLQKENAALREMVYAASITRRQQVLADFIRAGYNGELLIEQAGAACRFIEGAAPAAKAAKKRGRPAKKDIAATPKKAKKGKRKYTKRSKFWKKK